LCTIAGSKFAQNIANMILDSAQTEKELRDLLSNKVPVMLG
jgi:hypothetical protein